VLGGKGAEQAVALARLGLSPALVAVASADDEGASLPGQTERDCIDVSAVIRRPGAVTALDVGRARAAVQDPAGTGREAQ
jgi:ribokinase